MPVVSGRSAIRTLCFPPLASHRALIWTIGATAVAPRPGAKGRHAGAPLLPVQLVLRHTDAPAVLGRLGATD